MPRLPAFCQDCGALYPSPLRAKAPGKGNAFDVPVPCPACGGGGRVPGELFLAVAEAAERFLDADVPAGEAEGFVAALEGAGADGGSGGGEAGGGDGEEVLLEVARRSPAFLEPARRLAHHPPPVRRGVAAVLRTARELAGDGGGDDADEAPASDGRPEESGEPAAGDPAGLAARALTETLERHGVSRRREESPDEVAEARRRLREGGRNDPCPCGSGEKYKDCHWLEDLRTTRDRGEG